MHPSSNSVRDGDDPAVIVGMACRVPGATNPSQLWDLIANQRDVQRKIPEDRWNVDNFYDPNGAHKGTTNAKYGYFLDQDIGNFDAGFFGISGKEAEAMDPQQRLLLEVVYEALENAGITLDEINGSQTSVFCGCFTKDYDMMIAQDWDMYPKHTVTGTGGAILANRISYFYNLHGTSVTVDTACSSSLVCLHLGNQSLKTGESDISIIVGSSLHFDPREYILMTDLGMLSMDGRSRAFDAGASGYVRGEGICAAILKRQSDAVRNGDHIRAIVRATGTNHDGRTQGITLPSPEAQEALIRSTYEQAGLKFEDTQYFEAHGTGTGAGDPRETSAIGAVFAATREQPLYVGSVKTNIGHLEGSSGLAGIIKTTLALENHKIPPNMLFNNPNPKIKFEDWKISVPTELIPWEAKNGVRRASINSFGYGGTNAHVVLEGYHDHQNEDFQFGTTEEEVTDDTKLNGSRPYLIPLSSHATKAGEKFEKALQDHLANNDQIKPLDLAHSLSLRRSIHEQRSFVIGKNCDDLMDQLAVYRPTAPWTSANKTAPRLGFIFTGQGGQWYAMGRQLINDCAFFRQTLERCDAVLQALPDAPRWSVVAELCKSKEASLLGETEYSQPLCTALQLAIVDLLKIWGIEPSAVVGHSSGEMGAAYAAGILSFDNALIAAYYRGLYMSAPVDNSTKGGMMAIGLTEPEAVVELEPFKGRLAIAAINSPSTMTISGDEDAILELKAILTKRKVFARQLQVTQAFHSHHMYPLAPAYEAALRSLPGFEPQPPKNIMVSSVTGQVADYQTMDASYWARNMTNMVKFSEALTKVLDDANGGIDALIEIGPHPALKGPSRQTVQSLKIEKPYFASLTRGVPDYEGILALAGQLFSIGYPVDLDAVNQEFSILADGRVSKTQKGKRLSDLPSYAWEHRRYWAETRYTKELRLRESRHNLLGAPVPGSLSNHKRWRNRIILDEIPWLSEHVVDGKVIFPGAGYISMAIEGAIQMQPVSDIKAICLKDIVIKAALVLPESDKGVEMVVELRPVTTSAKTRSSRWFEFLVCSYDVEDRCTEHCHGLISVEQGPACLDVITSYPSSENLRKESDRSESAASFYRRLTALGLQYGPKFSLLTGTLDRGAGFAISPLDFDPNSFSTEKADATILHPTLLDGSFHIGFSAIESCLGRQLDEPFVPTFISALNLSGSFAQARGSMDKGEFEICCFSKLPSSRVAISDLLLRSRVDGSPLMEIQGLEVTSLGKEGTDELRGRTLFFGQKWQACFDLLDNGVDLPELHSLESLLDIYAHQHPNATMLHISSDAQRTREAIQNLGMAEGERRRIHNIHVHSLLPDFTPGDDFNALKESARGLLEFKEPQKESYDVVILSESVDFDARLYLKDNGVLILDGESPTSVSNMKKQFSKGNLSVFRGFNEVSTPPEDLTVIISPFMSSRSQGIFNALVTSYPGQVLPTTFQDLSLEPVSTDTIVVLSSLDQDIGDQKSFTGVQNLLTSVNKNIVWLTEGATMESSRPDLATYIGLLRSARSENDDLRAVLLDCGRETQVNVVASKIIQTLDTNLQEDELTEREGCIYIPRVEADDERNSKLHNGAGSEPRLELLDGSRPLALKIGQVGLLDSLCFAEDLRALNDNLRSDELEIKVKASAISLRDADICSGALDAEYMGDECAGIVTRVGTSVDGLSFKLGDRVIAFMPGQGAHCTTARNAASLCYPMPDTMDFSQAASLPVNLATAYYALVDIARIRPGETVLIHSAASGVGQMAVQLAKRAGARILVTVGSEAERNLLSTQYGLEISQMFSSRDSSFLPGVLSATGGNGADVVLNCLTGPLLHTSWLCVAAFGRFIELGNKDIRENTKMDMKPFQGNVMFASIDMITVFEQNKVLGARLLQNAFRLVEQGHIKPLSEILEISYANVAQGVRLVQKSDHVGSVVLVAEEGLEVPVLPAQFSSTSLFSADKTYLLVGGLGGLGRSMAEWMVRRGAKKLAFLSRSGAKRPEAMATIQWLQERDIKVDVYSGDVSKLADVRACVQTIGSSLAGVFHAAMVLQDTPLEKMSYEQWQACIRPKVLGAQNLHLSTLHLQLDFFVVFSSIAAILGSKAQANYSAANSFLDAFMRFRRESGLPGTTMNVGAVNGVGVIAENDALQKIMQRLGMDLINEEELLYLLEEAVTSDHKIKSANGRDVHQLITGISLIRADVEWATKPLLKNLYANHDFGNASETNAGGKPLIVLLGEAADPVERSTILLEAFMDKVSAVLATPREAIVHKNPLSSYGLDSIVAVEFRKWFRNSVGADVALFDILGAGSIGSLCEKAITMMKV